ncbi:MAG: rhombosortase [Oceanicoccus sp.]
MIKPFFVSHYPIIAVVALVISCALAGDELSLALRFEREAIIDGEWYRMLTGHFVHLNWVHALMNIAAAVIGWFLFRNSFSNRQWLLSIVGCGLVISLLLFSIPDLQWYVGFSGIVHGLMLQGLIFEKRLRIVEKGLVISALLLKVAYELWQGSSSADLDLIDGNIVVQAHLFGLFGGLIVIVFMKIYSRRR